MKQNDFKNLRTNEEFMMDEYELTMSNLYLLDGLKDQKVAFDVFYRRNPDKGGYAVFAGLEHIISYIENLKFTDEDIEYLREYGKYSEEFLTYLKDFKFTGDIYSIKEGTVMYPNTPIMTVVAPMIEAQIVETALLLRVNHQSLIATKARRMVYAANGCPISDFGARRAHGDMSAVIGARSAYIGGVNSTATVEAGKLFGIPIGGTMAHSFVMLYKDEYTAFKKFAEIYPDNCVLLIDTYDVLHSGVPNAIKVAKEVLEPLGKRLKGVRIDSGDLAYLSKKTRKMLDKAGLIDCNIIVSNSIDEFTIESLNGQGAKINSYGIGERLITAKSDPVFGAVYKLVAVEEDGIMQPRIKVSENVEKITNPGLKKLWRIYDEEGKAIADLLTKWDEEVDLSKPYRYVDPIKPWKVRYYENCTAKLIQEPIFKNGKLVYELPTLNEIRNYVKYQFENEVWEEEQRFCNPHIHYLDMSPTLYEEKMTLLHNARQIEE